MIRIDSGEKNKQREPLPSLGVRLELLAVSLKCSQPNIELM